MNKKALLILLVLFYKTASAQFNDTTHYHLVIASTGAINQTDNTDAYLLNNSVRFGIKEKYMTLNTTNTWLYGKQNSTLTNDDYSSTLQLDIKKDKQRLYYWGQFNYNTGYSLKINTQVLGGAGFAYSIYEHKKDYVNISEGVLYDQSSLVAQNTYHTYRSSFRFMMHLTLMDIITLDATDFLQNSLSNGNDYIIHSTTNVGLRLRKWLSFTTALNYNKMDITHSYNLIYTYGLTADRYF